MFVVPITDRNSQTFIDTLNYRHSIFGKPQKYVFDNEFNNSYMREYFNNEEINVHFTSPLVKTGNGDIERVHGTINEHLRLLKSQINKETITKIIIKSVQYYNNSIHSTTNKKPIDFISNKIMNTDFIKIKEQIQIKQNTSIDNQNMTRKNIPEVNKKYIFIKVDKIRKSDPKYKKNKSTTKRG